jgi:hypothetical protein
MPLLVWDDGLIITGMNGSQSAHPMVGACGLLTVAGLAKDSARHLLTFFHAQGLLLNKKAVITKSKQHKQRYLVIYDVNGQVFSKIYNSIREIREDTGKKPTKICKYLLPPEHSV